MKNRRRKVVMLSPFTEFKGRVFITPGFSFCQVPGKHTHPEKQTIPYLKKSADIGTC